MYIIAATTSLGVPLIRSSRSASLSFKILERFKTVSL